MNKNRRSRYLKSLWIVALVMIVLSAVLSSRNSAHAAGKSAFTVLAGQHYDVGDVLAFAPQTIRVHRGDSITWKFNPVHDVHFVDKPLDFVVTLDIDGQKVPGMNSAIAFPNAQSGDAVKPGLNTGVLGNPGGPIEFTAVMDLAPGTYTYLCDIHAGMVGQITVVEDTVDIPTPSDVDKQGQKELSDIVSKADSTYITNEDAGQSAVKDNTLAVSAGFSAGAGSVNRFFPSVGVIQEGQSVNWTVPAGLEPHTINFSLPADGSIPEALVVVIDKKGTPFVTFGKTLVPTAKTGDSFTGADLGSGFLLPTQSFALKFPKAGVYKYFCAVHPGQVGTIVVLPASVPLSPPAAATQAATAAGTAAAK